MKLHYLSSLAVIALSIGMSSCTTGYHSIRTSDISGGVIQTPVMADLDVKSTKVTGSSVYITAKKYSDEGVNYTKGMAVTDALKNSNADVLVEPTFDVTIEDQVFSISIKTTVTGYPATYKNFRTATIADTTVEKMAMAVSSSNQILSAEPVPPPKKHLGLIIAGAIGLVLIVTLVAGGL